MPQNVRHEETVCTAQSHRSIAAKLSSTLCSSYCRRRHADEPWTAAAVTPPALILLNVAAFGGTVIVFAMAGSSRRCRYSSPLLGRGTASVGLVYPSGTDTLWVNCGSEEIESIRNSEVPFNVHCAVGSFAGGVAVSLTGGGGALRRRRRRGIARIGSTGRGHCCSGCRSAGRARALYGGDHRHTHQRAQRNPVAGRAAAHRWRAVAVCRMPRGQSSSTDRSCPASC